MPSVANSIYEIKFLDEMSQKESFIHSIHPLVKLLVTIAVIAATISYGKYEITVMIPLVIYPVVIFNLSDIPFMPIFKRSLIALPIVLGLGIFNPIFDRELLTVFENVRITGGWISYFSLIIKCFLTVICALLLISTTSIDKLATALRQLHVPGILITQFCLTYRYISVLLEEASSIWTAYVLRAPGQKGINYKVWGSLLGQLLIRTYDRAQRIYNCMVLRGYNGEFPEARNYKISLKDCIYLVIWIIFLLLVRIFNLPVLLGNIMTGVL